MLEIWRTAIYKGKIYNNYQVSNWGRVKSLNYLRTGKEKLLKPIKHKNGYLFVNLGKKTIFSIHRLVAETFLENPENKPCINHKIEGDEGKKMNFVFINEDGSINKEKSTIEWVTAKENINYGSHNKRMADTQKNDPNKSKRVLQFTKSGELIREWPSTMECGRNGFNQGCVAACCRGNTKLKTYKGYIWKYKERVD